MNTPEQLYNFAKAIEQWEADLVLCGECWKSGLPAMNQELFDRWMEIQQMRNAAIREYESLHRRH